MYSAPDVINCRLVTEKYVLPSTIRLILTYADTREMVYNAYAAKYFVMVKLFFRSYELLYLANSPKFTISMCLYRKVLLVNQELFVGD